MHFPRSLDQMTPKISYTVWFSQRNGSSLLCEALKATGVAGKPGELFLIPDGVTLLDFYQAKNYPELQQKIWNAGMTTNGVFGVKVNAPRKENDWLIGELRNMSGTKATHPTNFAVWENSFPHGKHLFLTRRNKVRQAVSWWKAIVTQEWHRERGSEKQYVAHDIRDRYDFGAIKHLLLESSVLESKIQAFLEEGGVVPLTIVYEDFIKEYEGTIQRVIDFLGIADDYQVSQPHYEQLADEVSEEWVDRFRQEIQSGWPAVKW